MSYTEHRSTRLVRMFMAQPWQGCDPMKAKFLFVGLDANYPKDIEKTLPELFDYINDGVQFWKDGVEGVHHPFLLPKFQGRSGKRYHKKFSEIGFKPVHARLVSFVELLHLATEVGELDLDDLSQEHLFFLRDVFDKGEAKYIFVCRAVTELLRQADRKWHTNWFPWADHSKPEMDGVLEVLRKQNCQIIYRMYHLSCFGWQLEELNQQIAQIRDIVESTADAL